MSVNGKRTDITRDDLLIIADQFTIKNPNSVFESVLSATELFKPLCEKQNIPIKVIEKIKSEFIKL